ncbi:MAG: phosphomethylpyrimidine synthase ThiC [Candidatus Omnitrophica bacterium]|nr:phosphomethylpyrimidine synthase ThiC [Candidatus Omnitrophota bacterium]
MTQLESARKNKVSSQMRKVANAENISVSYLLSKISQGKIVIPANINHKIKKICGIGEGLSTKVNVNIGTSTDKSEINDEIKKIKVAIRHGADTVMDLSVGGDLGKIRRKIIQASTIPVGTVPIYEVAVNQQTRKNHCIDLNISEILQVLTQQAEDGVDFFTIHAGIIKKHLKLLKRHTRILDVVSRGGAIIANYMMTTNKENPLYEYFDQILKIAKKFDVTLSLGDSLRPGSVLDGSDDLQFSELAILGKLAERARNQGVQVMIEGPGHLPLDQIEKNVILEKKLCNGAPFYVLGPLVTDIASGYDHITSAIGGAIAAAKGADFLCYVTPSEHLRHPSVQDVRDGLIASRIAAHSADLVKGVKGAIKWDKAISLARKKRDWKRQISLSIDSEKASAYRKSSKSQLSDVCTMCGDFCSIRLIDKCYRKSKDKTKKVKV